MINFLKQNKKIKIKTYNNKNKYKKYNKFNNQILMIN